MKSPKEKAEIVCRVSVSGKTMNVFSCLPLSVFHSHYIKGYDIGFWRLKKMATNPPGVVIVYGTGGIDPITSSNCSVGNNIFNKKI